MDSEKTCVEGLVRKDDLKQIKAEPNENGTEDMEIQSDVEVSEDDEKFIGPNLPLVMTNKEIEAFFQKRIAVLVVIYKRRHFLRSLNLLWQEHNCTGIGRKEQLDRGSIRDKECIHLMV